MGRLSFIVVAMQKVVYNPRDAIAYLAVAGQVEEDKLCQGPVSAGMDAVNVSTASVSRWPRDQKYFQSTKQQRLCAPDISSQNLEASE